MANNTRVYFLVDESASMGSYVYLVRDLLKALVKENDARELSILYHYIFFSDSAKEGTDISEIPVECGSTNIFSAFRKLHKLVAMAEPRPEKVIVVFISDGADNNPDKCKVQLQSLGRLPISSILLTIGVGSNFPTGLVVDILRPLYHQGSLALNPVIPVETLQDCDWAFAQLGGLIACKGEALGIPAEVTSETNTSDIVLYMKAVYNECIVTCAQSGRTAKENYENLLACKGSISAAQEILHARVSAEKADSRKSKPLASVLLSRAMNNSSAALTTSFHFVTKLNMMISDAQRGVLISNLSDEAKKELLGYTNIAGKYIATAMTYKAASFRTTLESLARLLRDYTPTEADEELMDPIHMCSQAEYFQDAVKIHRELIFHFHTLAKIIDFVSFVGRCLTLEENQPTDALQLNPWLYHVKDLPKIHSHMTTYDFYKTHGGDFEARGEKVNGLMILGGNASSPGVFTHIASYGITQNVEIYEPYARLAAAASVLLHILSTHSRIDEWVEGEFKMIESVCRWSSMNFAQWSEYLDGVASTGDYRKCLVSQSSDIKTAFTCPGLTKFFLAMWVSIRVNKRQYTMDELVERHTAVVFEFLGRYNAQNARSGGLRLTACFDYSFTKTPYDFLDGFKQLHAIVRESPTVALAQAEFNSFLSIQWPFVKFEDFMSPLVFTPARIEAAVYQQFTLQVIKSSFGMLAEMCGHGDKAAFDLPPTQFLHLVDSAAMGHSSITRSKIDLFAPPLPYEQYAVGAGHNVMVTFKRAVADMAPNLVKEVFVTRATKQHAGLARIIPKSFMERFSEEYGRDIRADWCVNGQGLSMIACCSPDCDHYLKRLSKVSHTSIHHRLSEHLGCAGGIIPGFHKTVAKSLELDTPDIVLKIKNGECLDVPIGKFVHEARCKLPDEQHDDFVSFCETRFTVDMRKNIDANIKAGARHFMEMGVEELKAEYASPTWAYDDFAKTFLAMYEHD